MAKITYGSGDKTLQGSNGKDSFVVDLAVLSDQTTTLADVGGSSDTLQIIDTSARWLTRAFVNTGSQLSWKGKAGGQINIPLVAGEPVVEFLEWRDSANSVVLRLRLLTDLTPDTGGNIALIGSKGADTIIVPDAGGMAGGQSEVYGGGGADTITASATELTVVYGGSGADLIVTPGPAVGEFYGQNGHDVLWGCSGNDLLYGGKGRDTLFGFDGADILGGGAGRDHLVGAGGGDVLNGGKGRDNLEGGDSGDTLNGGLGNDTLEGGRGSDILTGGRGRDLLSGGSGADIFSFVSGQKQGRNTLTDFSDGADLLRIEGGIFADLVIGTTPGGAAKISLPGGTVIILQGIEAKQISAADFEFV